MSSLPITLGNPLNSLLANTQRSPDEPNWIEAYIAETFKFNGTVSGFVRFCYGKLCLVCTASLACWFVLLMSCWEKSCRTFAVFFFLCIWDIVFRFTFHYCCLLSALHYPSWIKTFGGALALRSTGKYTMALPVNKSTKGMREEINRPMTFTVLHCGTGFKPFIYLPQACKQYCLPLFKLAYLVQIFFAVWS